MTRFLDETRERFLLAIGASIAPERFLELYFFAPIRQGGIESGVAVIAAHPDRATEPPILADAPPPDETEPSPGDSGPRHQSGARERYTVYAAKYRFTLKGPERGRWECTVVAEADAPLVTVEDVVRGVQRRSGDAEEPERMSGDEARGFTTTADCGLRAAD